MPPGGSARETMTGALTDLEHRLIYDVARLRGQPLGSIAVLYGVEFDETTGRLYRQAQDTKN